MEYALSQKDGVEHRAVAVTYDKAKALNLICPVCGGKVFKRVRHIPEENHCFVHHKGGSLDCELYHAGTVTLTGAAFDAMARGQDFQLFIKQVEQSIEGLLTKTRIVTSINHAVLELWKKNIASIDFEMDKESFDHVEECAIAHLGEAGLIQNVRVSRILDAKLRFYRHPQARFIDKSIIIWMLYVIATKHPRANAEKLADVMTTNTVEFEKTAGLIFAGLAARDAGVGLSWFSRDFDKFLCAQARRGPKSILNPKSARSKLESHEWQPHEDATIINKTLSHPRPEAYAQAATQPNPVDVRFELAKQRLIKAGYRFQPFGLGIIDVAIAPDGAHTKIYSRLDLDKLLNNLVDGRFESAKQRLIKAGYRFQPFGLGIIDVAVAPDGAHTKIYSRLDLDRLVNTPTIEKRADALSGKDGGGATNCLQTATSQSMQDLASSKPELVTLPSDPEKEKLLRDFQDRGWSVSHDGFKWAIWKDGAGSVSAYTADEIRRFWYSNRKN